MGMIDREMFVSREELMNETGLSNGTVAKYLAAFGYKRKPVPREKKDEVVGNLRKMFDEARRVPNAALVKGQREDGVWDWRVSLQGGLGWIVIRTGTEEDMKAWADLLVKNGIKARAVRNEYKG